ncbi:MAG TPA: class I SAM-dependent methyltransferase [Mycobacterium sp.]|nr:class I SAM-dependent methyltransferase [Mycobacterium sp.]
MAAHQPRAETATDGMWSPALARGLIRDDVLRSMRCCDGYTDLLMPSAAVRRSRAMRAVRSPAMAPIHDHLWRSSVVAAVRTPALVFTGDQRVLDVACGPGNFSSFVASHLSGDGFVIGLDDSARMMARAGSENSCARAVYMRADELSLPFNDHAFDLVYCFAALHLLPEPFGVLQEMVRVLAPGGRIAVITTYGRESMLRTGLQLGATICGVRMFDRTTVPAFFAAAGLADIDQRLRGISQFVIARRPKQESDYRMIHTGVRKIR